MCHTDKGATIIENLAVGEPQALPSLPPMPPLPPLAPGGLSAKRGQAQGGLSCKPPHPTPSSANSNSTLPTKFQLVSF